jgi:glyoxylase-like metal-dependent hydrolase (beta-lactamase superfamily II)
MPGLNHVEPGGEPLVLPLAPTLTLTKLSVGPMDNNAYLLRTPEAALLVDAAAEPERLLRLIGADLATVVTTHRHGDHWQALGAVAETTGAQLVCGRPDVDAIATGAWVEGLVGVWDGDVVVAGAHQLEVIGLVGHTPGSIALACTGADGTTHLFTGDSLFPGGPGKTAGAVDFATLMDDLEEKVFGRFGDDTVVHPGHGDDTTLGVERPHLSAWRARGW